MTDADVLGREEEEFFLKYARAPKLFCRVDGMRKLPVARRLDFLLDGVRPPLNWLTQHPDGLRLGRVSHG